MEKKEANYSVRIPRNLKILVESLPETQAYELRQRIRVEIARAVHNSHFNPEAFLNGMKGEE